MFYVDYFVFVQYAHVIDVLVIFFLPGTSCLRKTTQESKGSQNKEIWSFDERVNVFVTVDFRVRKERENACAQFNFPD